MTEIEQAIGEGLVLADFGMPNCGFCNLMEPAVNELAKTYPQVKVLKVNLQEQPAAGEQFKVTDLPLFVLLKDGHEVARLIGTQPFHVLAQFVQRGLHG